MNRLIALLLCLFALPALAADPPGRVGWLSYAEGEVSVFTDPERGWERATVNSHITSENSVWADARARAEVRVGSLALRLAETTQLDIVRLDDQSLAAHVPSGSLAVRMRELDAATSVVVTTPAARFVLRTAGRYRIDAAAGNGDSRLTVLAGSARAEVGSGFLNVEAGRSILIAGGGRESFELQAAAAGPLDDWALARDEREANRESLRYVSAEMTGWEVLDDYGSWRTEPEYGPIWYPATVSVGWAPYRYGRWTWVRPYGWAWVDDAPWGYAPFHYGRWVSIGGRWGWFPGPYHRHPVWAPALVGWVGTPGWSVTIGSSPVGVVGWYPLSPYERYQPWYTTNVTYVNRVNHVVIVNRPDRPGGRDHPRRPEGENRERGATVVPRENFGSRRPVQGAIAPVAPGALASQPVVSGTAVLPPRNDPRGSQRPGTAPRVFGTAPSSTGTAPPATGATPSYPLAKPATVAPATMQPPPPASTVAPQPINRPAPSAPVAKPVPSTPPSFTRPPAAYPQSEPRPAPMPAQPLVKPAPAPEVHQPRFVPAPAQPEVRTAPSAPVAKPTTPHGQPMAKPAEVDRPEAPVAKPAQSAEKPAKP